MELPLPVSTLQDILERFIRENGSDLYFTVGAPVMMRKESELIAVDTPALTEADIRDMLGQLLPEDVQEEFDSTLEYNSALQWNAQSRFRINVFRQRQQTGMVLRRIIMQIPTIADLCLPRQYADLAMEKRGLVLIVGPTGSGKTSSLAAMIDHRNERSRGHIITIEDPVEFIHAHKGCIITQRDVGIDTYSFGIALKNALRQRPDVVVIGEIRDRDTMEHAIMFSETGHLCLATLHASNSHQAIERIVSFFPEEKHLQMKLSLSHNLRGILSQRLVHNVKEQRALAVEILLNQGLIKTLIQEGKIREMKEIIERSRDQGMVSFDQSLFDLYSAGEITETVALAEADNTANLRLLITQHDMAKRMGVASPLRETRQNTGF